MNFLGGQTGYELFAIEARKRSYVDKTMLIDAVYRYAMETNRYICVTRPRRFGKSTAANMVAAFFDESTAEESEKLFSRLAIGSLRKEQDDTLLSCWSMQGKGKVIRINMIDLLVPEVQSYQDFYQVLHRQMMDDLKVVYPHLAIGKSSLLPEALSATGDKFIFVLDEWDAIFEMRFMTEKDKEDYILFLKALLKDKKYVQLAYMTGILPISKYSSGSPLNMFEEFSAFQDDVLFPWFGLTREEIAQLMEQKGMTRPSLEELAFWYDGYIRSCDGVRVYNPASVSKALGAGVCRNYWTGTGPMNEVRDIIQRNVKDLREDILRMVGGESLDIRLSGFSVEKSRIITRDEILSAMVVYGFLSYYEEQLRIPNHELMIKFQEALASEPLGLNQSIMESKKLLRATLDRDHEEVARLLEELHNEKIPFFKYNDENSLACVVTVGYLAALDKYRITREAKAGKGYADFLFEPLRKTDTAIILELKYGHSAEDALRCIHERDYVQRFKGWHQVLLVGINYSERTKKHTCLTEVVEQIS